MRNVVSLGCILLFPLAGCDAVESLLEQIASETDAREAIAAMVDALSEAQPSEQAMGEPVHRAAGNGEQIVDHSQPCSGGGRVDFEGTLDLQNVGGAGLDDDFDPTSDDLPSGVDDVPSVGFSYEVRFDGCTVDGVILDGRLNYTLETRWDATAGEFDATWDYQGSVDVTGTVEGRCDFSFGGTGTAALEAWASGLPGAFDGDACGYEAAELGI